LTALVHYESPNQQYESTELETSVIFKHCNIEGNCVPSSKLYFWSIATISTGFHFWWWPLHE